MTIICEFHRLICNQGFYLGAQKHSVTNFQVHSVYLITGNISNKSSLHSVSYLSTLGFGLPTVLSSMQPTAKFRQKQISQIMFSNTEQTLRIRQTWSIFPTSHSWHYLLRITKYNHRFIQLPISSKEPFKPAFLIVGFCTKLIFAWIHPQFYVRKEYIRGAGSICSIHLSDSATSPARS